MKQFDLGERVKPLLGGILSYRPLKTVDHGIVVPYNGRHDPRNPRVRWISGWGTTCRAEDLVLLSEHEANSLPTPELLPMDRRQMIIQKTEAIYITNAPRNLMQKIREVTDAWATGEENTCLSFDEACKVEELRSLLAGYKNTDVIVSC